MEELSLVPEIDKRERRKPVRRKPAFIKAPLKEQPELIGRTLDEMIDAVDPVRLVKKLACLIDIGPLMSGLKLQGGPSYDPRRLLVLWVFALWDGERSSRKIEKRCKADLRYLYLMDGLSPDHSTICRFRRQLGDSMDHLISQTVELGVAQGIVGFRTASLDGSKLPSAASQWRKYRMEAAEADGDSEQEPKDKDEPEMGKGGGVKASKPSSDPEARTQRLTSGGYVYGYNGQALVDCDSGMVLTSHITSCASDSGELIPALAKCLDTYGELPEQAIADAGYDAPANSEALSLSGVEGWISPKYEKWIWTSSGDGKPLCPEGHEAQFKDSFKRKGGQKVVRLAVKQCPTCPQKATCHPKGRKTISYPAHVDISHHLILRQRCSQAKEQAKRMRGLRAQTSELCFAVMKEKLKLRRLLLRGTDGAGIEFGLAALASNFLVLKRNLSAESIQDLLKDLRTLLIALFQRSMAID